MIGKTALFVTVTKEQLSVAVGAVGADALHCAVTSDNDDVFATGPVVSIINVGILCVSGHLGCDPHCRLWAPWWRKERCEPSSAQALLVSVDHSID